MINNIQFSFSLHGIDLDNLTIRRSFEDSLKNYRFSYWSIPPNAPADVIRMYGNTVHGHSLLQLSNKLIHLTINYDEAYRNDLAKCKTYADEKVLELINTLEKLNIDVIFNGVIIRYIFNDIEKPIERLTKKLICFEGHKDSLYSVGTRLALVYKDHFFVNFDLSSLLLPPEKKPALGVIVDVNDRYGAERNVPVTVRDILKITDIQEKINQDVIIRLLDEGVLDLL